jgi:polysaccharide biosynthesis acetyltransferase WcbI-like protein
MGAMAAMTQSVLIYANCQGEELQKTGQFMHCMAGRLNFKWIPFHLVTEQDWVQKYTQDFMSDVVTVWEQVETGGASLNRAALHERLPKNVPIVTFPPLSVTCLWPFAGNDPRLAQDPDRYPWPDSIAAALSPEILSDDEMFTKYLRVTIERMPDLDRRLRLDIARWKAVDAIADIKLADWVEKTFRSVNLFYTSGHIAPAAITFLIKQLLSRTGILTPTLARTAMAEVDILLHRHTGQDFECVPIHPIVAKHLNLRFYDPDKTYRWHAHEWSFRQYILHYIRWTNYLR